MCIIACKPAGVKLPNWNTIVNMWYSNPDGAGLMFYNPKSNKVHIEKGLMTLDKFEETLERLDRQYNLQRLAVVMHFRIKTHGDVSRSCTHPFPISDNITVLGKPVTETNIGVAHNGIIDITPRSKDISDTMEYIASQLAPLVKFCPQFYRNKHAMQMIKNAIGSKMAFLTRENKIYTIGDFTEDEGILYSNTSYKGWSRYSHGKFGCYSDYGYDDYGWDDYNYVYDTKAKCYIKTDRSKDDDWAEHRMLMDLYASGSIVTNGVDKDYGFDVYLDERDRVWVYDYDSDKCMITTDAKAITEDGIPVHFDRTFAELMPCFPEKYSVELFDAPAEQVKDESTILVKEGDGDFTAREVSDK